MTTIGFLGAGGVARVHAKAIQEVEGATLKTIYDLNDEASRAMADSHNAETCGSVDELIDSCDAVYILTPPHTHRELAEKALGRGIHVMCEKPLAISLDDGKAIAEAVAKSTATFMPGFSMRYRPSNQRLKSIFDSGALGAPITFWYQRMFGGGSYDPNNWRYRPESQSGMSIESLSHQIDTVRWILGDIDTVYANVTASFAELPDVDNNVHATFTLKNRAAAILHVSWSSYLSFNTTGINGTEGTVRIWGKGGADHDTMYLNAKSADSEQIIDLAESYNERIMANECQGFINLIHELDNPEGLPAAPSVDDALQALEISHAMLISSKNNTVIEV